MSNINFLLCNFLEKVDRIITGRQQIAVQCIESQHNEMIGCQQGNQIHLNIPKIKQLFNDSKIDYIIGTKGINYHELAHLLFTEKSTFYDNRRLIEGALEDCRIECLFSSLYPKAKTYFKHSYINLCVQDKGQNLDVPNLTLILLTWGRRKFIPGIFVTKAEEGFLKAKDNKTLLKHIEKLCDEFIVADKARRDVIVEEINKLLYPSEGDFVKNGRNAEDRANDDENSKRLKGFNKDKIKKAVEKHKEEMKEHEKKEKQKQEEKQEKQDMQRKQENNDVQEEDGDSWKEAEGDGGSETGGSGEVVESGDIGKEEIQVMKEGIEEELKEDIKEDLMSIVGGKGAGRFIHDDAVMGSSDFPEKYKNRALKNKMLNLFKKIKEEKDFSWRTNLKTGKLHSKRIYKIGTDDFKIFKKWRTSELEQFKKDIAIVMDSSGSMCNYRNYVFQIGWALGESLKTENLGNVSMLHFGKYYNVIKSFFKKTYNFKEDVGGQTMVSGSLEHVFKNITKCQNNRVLIVISDLQFGDYGKAEWWIRRIKDVDTKVIFVVPHNKDDSYVRHFKDKFGNVHLVDMTDFDKIVKLFYGVMMSE